MAETFVMQALQMGLSEIQQDPLKLAEILTALNSQEMAAAQGFFASKTAVTIAPGFPSDQSIFPFIGVTVADEDMIAEQTPIGLAYYTERQADGSWIDTMGARFTGALKCTIYTPNVDVLIWVSAVMKWALLKSIPWFHTEEGGDMNNIRIRIADYEPSPQWLSTFTFTRGVIVFAEYDSTFTGKPTVVTSVVQNPTYQPQQNS